MDNSSHSSKISGSLVFDWTICCTWAVFLFYFLFSSELSILFLPLTLLLTILRMNVGLLVSRGDKGAWKAILAFTGVSVAIWILVDNLTCSDPFDLYGKLSFILANLLRNTSPKDSAILDSEGGHYLIGGIFFILVNIFPIIWWLIKKIFRKMNGNEAGMSAWGWTILKDNYGQMGFSIIGLLLLCELCGLSNYPGLRIVGLLLLPIAFYAIVCKNDRGKWYEYLLVIAFSYCFAFTFEAGPLGKIILLALSTILAGTISAFWAIRTRNGWFGPLMFVLLGIVIPIMTFGAFPYVRNDETLYYSFVAEGYTYSGAYVTLTKDGKSGLRDRYGIVIPAQYKDIDSYPGLDNYLLVGTKEDGTVDLVTIRGAVIFKDVPNQSEMDSLITLYGEQLDMLDYTRTKENTNAILEKEGKTRLP